MRRRLAQDAKEKPPNEQCEDGARQRSHQRPGKRPLRPLAARFDRTAVATASGIITRY